MQKGRSQGRGKTSGPSKHHTPYVYLVASRVTGMKYYGARYAAGCAPEDLWSTYFTSSKEVHQLIEKHGVDSFDREVRKTFDTAQDAINWEGRVLRRLNARARPDFLNKHNNDGLVGLSGDMNPMRNPIHLDTWRRSAKGNKSGRPLSEEHKAAISLSLKGRVRTDSERAAISRGLKGHVHTDAFRELRRAIQTGKVPSAESRQKKRDAIKGRKKYTKDGAIRTFLPGTEPEGWIQISKTTRRHNADT